MEDEILVLAVASAAVARTPESHYLETEAGAAAPQFVQITISSVLVDYAAALVQPLLLIQLCHA